jgi:beta-glucosidase
MKQFGLKSYRISITWPRIQLTGRESANQAGLDYCSRLTDGLLEPGIQPLATLCPSDLPQALSEGLQWVNGEP